MLRTLAALAEDSDSVLSSHVVTHSSLVVILVPEDLMPTSDLQKYQACMWYMYMPAKHSHT